MNKEKITIIYGDNASGKTNSFNMLKQNNRNKNNTFISVDDMDGFDEEKSEIFYKDAQIVNDFCKNFLINVAQYQQIEAKLPEFKEKDIKSILELVGGDYIKFINDLGNYKDELLHIPVRSIIKDDEKFLSIWEDVRNFKDDEIEKIIDHLIREKILSEISPWTEWKDDLFTISFKELEPLTQKEGESSIYKILSSYTPIQLKNNIEKIKYQRLSYDRKLILKNSFMDTIKEHFDSDFKLTLEKSRKITEKYAKKTIDETHIKLIHNLIERNENFENIEVNQGNTNYSFKVVVKEGKISRGQKAILFLIKNIVEAKNE